MKGIVLAGGTGTRLHPLTIGVSKQLLPVYDKPMIYYPISMLLLAGIKEILIITTPVDADAFKRLLGDGRQWGVKFEYAVQAHPEGIAQALFIGEDFLAEETVALVLGDNLFYGSGIPRLLKDAVDSVADEGATVFAQKVHDPQRYGVITFGDEDSVVSIEEKPANPCSPWAVTGLYFYDSSAVERARLLKPSPRGELEITALNKSYLEDGLLRASRLWRGHSWFDTGTFDSLVEAAEFVRVIDKRQGVKISCIEEIVFRLGYISSAQLVTLAEPLVKSGYGSYLMAIAELTE